MAEKLFFRNKFEGSFKFPGETHDSIILLVNPIDFAHKELRALLLRALDQQLHFGYVLQSTRDDIQKVLLTHQAMVAHALSLMNEQQPSEETPNKSEE